MITPIASPVALGNSGPGFAWLTNFRREATCQSFEEAAASASAKAFNSSISSGTSRRTWRKAAVISLRKSSPPSDWPRRTCCGPEAEPKFRPLYNHYLDLAESHLAAGWAYTNLIPLRPDAPSDWPCAWPILFGLQTIERLRSGNVLDAGQRIKSSAARKCAASCCAPYFYYPRFRPRYLATACLLKSCCHQAGFIVKKIFMQISRHILLTCAVAACLTPSLVHALDNEAQIRLRARRWKIR